MDARIPPESRSPPPAPADEIPVIEVWGAENRVCWLNAAFCRLSGERAERLLGRPLTQVLRGSDYPAALRARVPGRQTRAPVDAGLAGSGESDSEGAWLHVLRPDADGPVPSTGVIVRFVASPEQSGDVAAMNEALLIGALRQHELRVEAESSNAALQAEIAARTLAQQELQKAEARLRAEAEELEGAVAERTAQLRASVEQLEAFSYSLAHDLRAPVRAIQGLVLLAWESPGTESWAGAEYLHRLSRAAARMEELIQDVLSLNRIAIQPIQLARIDVDAVLRGLLAEDARWSAERAEIQVEAGLPVMLGHEASFRQCLSNLLENAVKFVAPGKRARVRVRAELRGAVKREGAGSDLATARVRLWVEDEGIGIAPEQRAKIFQLFQRLHPDSLYEGTGLGLAIVQKAIERMGGSVGVETGPRGGSAFWLELPEG
jgi:signal transduction histidine kinase